MPKLKVTENIKDYKGEDIKEAEVKVSPSIIQAISQSNLSPKQIVDLLKKELDKAPLTFRDIIHHSLNTVPTKEDGKLEVLSAKDKAVRYEITTKLFATDEPDFTDTQVDTILECVDKIYQSPLIYGRIKDALK